MYYRKCLTVLRRCYSSEAHLTKNRYPQVKRRPYAQLTDKHVQYFQSVLENSRVLTSDLRGYNEDWLKMCCGYSQVVVKPKTTEEVSSILAYCYKENLAVCPQGGNTGLVGGSVPVFDEVILSLSLMNKIISIDKLSGTVVCEAGSILENLDNAVGEEGMMMPLDLGAKGSCQIGGNISTCAGGLRLLRYGSMLANTLGLQVVKADGEVIDCLNTLRKDNTGYHLRQMFVGAEGTLGVVTAAAIQCPVKPSSVNLAFLGLNKFEDVLKTYLEAKRCLSEVLSSCEMMDRVCMTEVTSRCSLKSPLSKETDFYMVIELQGSNSEHDQEKMSIFLERVMDSGLVVDGTMASEPSRIHALWQLRERITEALLKGGYIYKYDISLPTPKFYSIVGAIKERVATSPGIKSVSGFGHLGDGNIHLNVQAEEFDRTVLERIEPYIFEWTKSHDGSISAEHGMGFKKAQYLHYAKSNQAIEVMKHLKQMMDPKGILNPYKVLPYN